jgi:hypothetical protein
MRMLKPLTRERILVDLTIQSGRKALGKTITEATAITLT